MRILCLYVNTIVFCILFYTVNRVVHQIEDPVFPVLIEELFRETLSNKTIDVTLTVPNMPQKHLIRVYLDHERVKADLEQTHFHCRSPPPNPIQYVMVRFHCVSDVFYEILCKKIHFYIDLAKKKFLLDFNFNLFGHPSIYVCRIWQRMFVCACVHRTKGNCSN